MKQTKYCTICNQTYETRNLRSVACSLEHLSEWRRRTYKGRKFTPEHIAKLSVSKLRENVVKYGEFNCEVCLKVFDTNTALRSHKSYCSSRSEPQNVACNKCGKILKRQRGLTWHMKSHEVGFFEEHSRKVSESLAIAKPRKRVSEAEHAFIQSLVGVHGPNVVHGFRINGINHEYDYFVPDEKLIIEFDGDYWHGNPELHVLTPKMKRQYCIDVSYTRAAEALGYTVRRIWESETLNYPENLRKI